MSIAEYLGPSRLGRCAWASALACAAAPALAAPILDALETCPPPGPPADNVVTFGAPDVPTIPADFFSPGSDPFSGPVHFVGVTLDSIATGNASVIIHRFNDPVQPNQPPGANGQVPMEIQVMSLVSVQPIVVTTGGANPQQWDVSISLSGVQPPPGQLQAQKTHPNGGVFNAFFPVQPVFTFVNRDTFDERIIDTGQLGFPPLQMHVNGAHFVHAVSPNLPVILPLPGSNWVPGIQQTAPGNINSQVLVPFFAQSGGGGVTHTVCTGGPKIGRCEVVSKLISYSSECVITTNPDGTKNAQGSISMDASFRDNASCCEYRQYVKGTFTLNGQIAPKKLDPGIYLEENVFHEDGFGYDPVGSRNPHYGHRNETGNPSGDRYSNPANRKAGDTYHGTDAPGWRNMKPGRSYAFNLTFLGTIIDTCNQLSMKPHEWTMSCSGTALGAPGPLVEILIDTTINGLPALLGIYRYPGDILTVVASISNGNTVPIDASEVGISVKGLVELDSPDDGALPESVTDYATAHAFYDFDLPPGTPMPLHVTFDYGPLPQDFFVDVTLPCPEDIDQDGNVGIVDFLTLLGAWGPCPGPCPPTCPADLDQDCSVGIVDFLALLAAWGPCP